MKFQIEIPKKYFQTLKKLIETDADETMSNEDIISELFSLDGSHGEYLDLRDKVRVTPVEEQL